MITEKRKDNTMPVWEYGVFGPFDVPRDDDGRVAAAKDRRRFWNKVVEDNKKPGLSTASGCYIFGIRASNGATPWYVGQAKYQFREECFTDSKLLRYNKILAGGKKGTPILLLLARMTPKEGSFQGRLSELEANNLETLLIGKCVRANPDLLNISRTAFFKNAKIPGLLNSPPGAPSPSVEFLKRLLNLK